MQRAFKIALFIFISLLNSHAQSSKTGYTFELGTYFSVTNKMPFWQANNQYGVVPQTGQSIICKQSIYSKKDTIPKKYAFKYGVELATIVGRNAQILLPQAFISQKFGAFQLWAGRKKEKMGIMDTLMTSGSVTWSGNALPIPKIQLEIPEYRKLLFNWLSVKGFYSHGWFLNQTFVKNYYLHQKSLYLRLGKPNAVLKLHGGLLHNVQWGGTPKYKLPEGDSRFFNGTFSHDWFTYSQVVLPLKHLGEGYGTYNSFELTNRFGNHVGQLDIATELDFKNSNWLFYKQNVFETGAFLSSLTNADDGLYGISYKSRKKRFFKTITTEFLYTKNQGTYQSFLPKLLGLQDRQFGNQTFFFNHMQYLDGWSYNDMPIGSPFLLPQEKLRIEKQSGVNSNFTNNNRVIAYYLGMINQINSVNIETRISYSQNFGAFGFPIKPARQLSTSFKAIIPAQKLRGNLVFNIAIDQGDLIKDNYGVCVSYMRAW